MGHSLSRHKSVSPELLKPQGLYSNNKDIDLKRLKRNILDKKLAPCYKASDFETALAIEECSICMLYYPALNRTRCCTKGLCTECFLQIKNGAGTRASAPCPFCKESLIVSFHGPRTMEERLRAKKDEQAVREAQIRARESEELQAVEMSRLRVSLAAKSLELQQAAASPAAAPRTPRQPKPSLAMRQAQSLDPKMSQYVPENILQDSDIGGAEHMDLNDLMLMQAIYASLREQSTSSEGHAPSSEFPLDNPFAAIGVVDQTHSGSGPTEHGSISQLANTAHEGQEPQPSSAQEPPSPSHGNQEDSVICGRDNDICGYHDGTLPSAESSELSSRPSSHLPSVRPGSSNLGGIQQSDQVDDVSAAHQGSSCMAADPALVSDVGPALAEGVCDDQETGAVGMLGYTGKATALTESFTDFLAPVSPVSDVIPALHRVSGSDVTLDHELLDSSADMSQTTTGGSKAGSEFEISYTSTTAGHNSQEEDADWDAGVVKPPDAVLKQGFSVFPRFRLRTTAPTPVSGASNDVILGMVLVDDLNIALDQLPRHVPSLPSLSGEVHKADTLCASLRQDQVSGLESSSHQAQGRTESPVAAVEDQLPTAEAPGKIGLDVHGGAVLLQNPDGSEQLVLLTNDACPPEPEIPCPADEQHDSFTAPSDPADVALISAIARDDQHLQSVYVSSLEHDAGPSPADDVALVATIAQHDQKLQRVYEEAAQAGNSTSAGEDAWLTRMRAQDEALTRALNMHDAAVAAAASRC